jgi:LacI family transcriptional regulator
MTSRKKVALFHKEWSETSVRMMEGVFSHPEIRQRCEFRDFPLTRGGGEIQLPSNWQPDGVLFTLDEGDPRANLLAGLGVPTVRLDGEWADDPFSGVSVDLLGFARQSLRHFEKLSCPNLLFVGPGSDSRSRRVLALLRRFGARSEVREVRGAFFRVGDPLLARTEEHLSQHPEVELALRQMPRPFGIVTLRENDAVYLLNACRELGIRVPQDAGILSGADSRMAQFTDPPLSSLVIDYLEMGRKAVTMLERLMAGQTIARRYERQPVSGVNARASTLGDSPLDQSIERVRQMIQNRACEGITVEEILGHLDMSRPTLEKRYRELTGMSPAQHIRQIRAAKARELLTTTNMSVTQVARRIGFDDPRPFMVFFKREFGQTPGAFRAAHA